MSSFNYVISFDPGGTTGWAVGIYNDTMPLEFIDGGQIDNGVEGLVDFIKSTDLHTYGALLRIPDFGVTVVSESFTLRPGVPHPDLTPVRIEGALAALLGSDVVVYQQPAKKALVPDSRLRKAGLWLPGQRHHMDARIHGLVYMLGLRHEPTIRKYWPHLYSEEDNGSAQS